MPISNESARFCFSHRHNIPQDLRKTSESCTASVTRLVNIIEAPPNISGSGSNMGFQPHRLCEHSRQVCVISNAFRLQPKRFEQDVHRGMRAATTRIVDQLSCIHPLLIIFSSCVRSFIRSQQPARTRRPNERQIIQFVNDNQEIDNSRYSSSLYPVLSIAVILGSSRRGTHQLSPHAFIKFPETFTDVKYPLFVLVDCLGCHHFRLTAPSTNPGTIGYMDLESWKELKVPMRICL